MQTKTIGQILRAEREFHNLTLAELAHRTRIRLEYLQALEADDYTKLPASTFVKGYIRTYGELFSFNYQPLIAMLRRDYRESAQGALVPRDFIKPVLKKKSFWTPLTYLLFGLATVFGVLLLYIGFQWWQLQQPPDLFLFSPEEDAQVAAQVVVQGQTEPDAIVTVNNQPVSLQPDGQFQTELSLVREGLNTITVEATDRRGQSRLVQRTVRVAF